MILSRKYLELTAMLLHLLLLRWHVADVTQTSLVTPQRVLCVFSVSDHNINRLQPEIKWFTLY